MTRRSCSYKRLQSRSGACYHSTDALQMPLSCHSDGIPRISHHSTHDVCYVKVGCTNKQCSACLTSRSSSHGGPLTSLQSSPCQAHSSRRETVKPCVNDRESSQLSGLEYVNVMLSVVASPSRPQRSTHGRSDLAVLAGSTLNVQDSSGR